MAREVLALLNQPSAVAPPHTPGAPTFAFVEVGQPQLSALDLGATRGDGIFESISVGGGYPQSLEPHLERFATSASALDLPEPNLRAWRECVQAAAAALDPAEESWVKIVMTRGVEGDGRPTGWVYAAHSPDFTQARTAGVRVVTLDRGYRHDVAQSSPWLLAGAKTLSYAVNRSALREAARRGADDVIFVSSDGFVLEGPTSTVILRQGASLVTPDPGFGILKGTTQATIFGWAAEQGFATSFARLVPADLHEADAVWLVSSVRLAAPVRKLDGRPVAVDTDFTARANAALRAQRS